MYDYEPTFPNDTQDDQRLNNKLIKAEQEGKAVVLGEIVGGKFVACHIFSTTLHGVELAQRNARRWTRACTGREFKIRLFDVERAEAQIEKTKKHRTFDEGAYSI